MGTVKSARVKGQHQVKHDCCVSIGSLNLKKKKKPPKTRIEAKLWSSGGICSSL